MIEKIVSKRNIKEAIKQVVSNQGSAGVDGMSVKALTSYMKTNRDALATRCGFRPLLSASHPGG